MDVTSISQPSFDVPEDILNKLSPKSRTAITRLLSHKPEEFDLSKYPTNRLAAVLVLLYEKKGELHVLLTTRSKKLRSHPGQTALPGGKCDNTDADIIDTAYREAHEEVGLPRRSSDIHTLCLLRPSLSKYRLIVTPVVALLSDLSILDALTPCEGEVDQIFDHPLEAILDPSLAKDLQLSGLGSEHWPYPEELYNASDAQFIPGFGYRMHRLRSTVSPIKGLTADILIITAEIAFKREPVYDRWAPGQPKSFAGIEQMLEKQEEELRKSLGVVAESESKHSSREHLPSV
ncbi:hypothetical protein ACEPAH_7983 [Sanghuangporus vaninii]